VLQLTFELRQQIWGLCLGGMKIFFGVYYLLKYENGRLTRESHKSKCCTCLTILGSMVGTMAETVMSVENIVAYFDI
jgi:hypothetical protein